MAAAKWQLAGHGAALAAVPVRDGGGRAVRRADRGLGKQVPGLDGRARPQARDRARPASGDRGGRRADPDRQGAARHRLAQPVGGDHPGRRGVAWSAGPIPPVASRRWPKPPRSARWALTDMRAMLGVLRTEDAVRRAGAAARLDDLGALVERVRATGLPVDLSVEGTPFPLGAARRADRLPRRPGGADQYPASRQGPPRDGHLAYDQPQLAVRIADDGTASDADRAARPRYRGHARTGRAARRHAACRAWPGCPRGLAGRGRRWPRPPWAGPDERLYRAGRRPAAVRTRLPDDPGGRAGPDGRRRGRRRRARPSSRPARTSPDVVLMDIRMPRHGRRRGDPADHRPPADGRPRCWC